MIVFHFLFIARKASYKPHVIFFLIPVKDEQIQQDAKTAKRDSNNSGPVYIEAMLTADQTTCQYYDDETLDYLLDIANLVIYENAA